MHIRSWPIVELTVYGHGNHSDLLEFLQRPKVCIDAMARSRLIDDLLHTPVSTHERGFCTKVCLHHAPMFA